MTINDRDELVAIAQHCSVTQRRPPLAAMTPAPHTPRACSAQHCTRCTPCAARRPGSRCAPSRHTLALDPAHGAAAQETTAQPAMWVHTTGLISASQQLQAFRLQHQVISLHAKRLIQEDPANAERALAPVGLPNSRPATQLTAADRPMPPGCLSNMRIRSGLKRVSKGLSHSASKQQGQASKCQHQAQSTTQGQPGWAIRECPRSLLPPASTSRFFGSSQQHRPCATS
jgi:hypothetical protein